MRIGCFLSTEKFPPAGLLAQAKAAEQNGVEALWISGFDEVYVANVGPHQEGFFRPYVSKVFPRLR